MNERRRGEVLVIDDDQDIRDALEVVLTLHGYHVTTAEDGTSALALLRDGSTRPNVILLDLMMPGMNGQQFRAAQMSDPAIASIPVFVMSGAVGVEAKATAMGLPSIRKPFDLTDVIGMMEQHTPGPS
jgi:CheY-like chemotaxis protein